ncbi:succinyl-CoA ligase [ADP-forming] subunit beta [Candidatus Endolissoclinum faulkneri L5]|uniref:Succinate--CoA ligase [ADP-forming] subunit beta n=1 Tax=Candidatus Endolissoclinum faulkneri L5 TaxID=1401328 RepID=V9TSS9_9PROT|nr:ADP-forming succinate--CoA ligase subunit beta [Candidatus Endolissoclinum faulkneri]AHC73979.1 succinyl-CoA ligase [ADP-forming] subunit beta [Candidatus Endolissoclinum faulkneri L5]
MNIHEYQAKALFVKHGIPVPKGGVAFSPEEAVRVAKDLRAQTYVVKAQIHAGGRGKGGGIRVAKSIDEVRYQAEQIINMNLITNQTSPEGRMVKCIYIEESSNIARELYMSLLVDRGTSRIAVIASNEGGVDIEELARKTPEKILTVPIDPAIGMAAHYARRIAFALKLRGKQINAMVEFLTKLYDFCTSCDALLVEINPLIESVAGDIVALDAKINFDDSALYRHHEIAAMRDEDEEDPIEVKANKCGLNYVKLNGSIGCMVNGAGLAMATMDIIKLYGCEPANFLDVGGGATKEQIAAAFELILSDKNVKGIMVNIFGGIMRCDLIAEGIVAAAKKIDLHMPLVIRLDGTNVANGKQILAYSGMKIIAADTLEDAARKIVNAVGELA